MKFNPFNIFCTLSLLLLSTSLQADKICNTALYQQLILDEKTVKRPAIIPSQKLRYLMENEELLCPMQVEKDFNGDGVIDWLGIIEQNNQFYLASYISGPVKHQFSKIKSYPAVPGNQYFDTASKQTLKKLAGIAPLRVGVKFAAIENQINGQSVAYAWDGKKMVEVIKFQYRPEQQAE